jgi:hypothetical protein
MKISDDLQTRLEELGMEFVRYPPPPVGGRTQVVSEELILGPRKIHEIVVPQFEKFLEVVVDPGLDSELFRKHRICGRLNKVAYLVGDTLHMGQELAEYVNARQSFQNIKVIKVKSYPLGS